MSLPGLTSFGIRMPHILVLRLLLGTSDYKIDPTFLSYLPDYWTVDVSRFAAEDTHQGNLL
jgi:hypothetical protein